jgi:hypothetical protein
MRRAFARTALLCAIALTVLPLATAHATTKYDMVKQFSIKQNPAGVWSYWDDNYSSPLPYAHRNYKGVKGFQCWSNKSPYVNGKVTIGVNKTGQTITLDKGNFVFHRAMSCSAQKITATPTCNSQPYLPAHTQ